MKIKCPCCNEELDITLTVDITKNEAAVVNGSENENPNKPQNVKCPDCGGEMISRKGQYGTFWGCKKYPDCRGTRDSMGRSKAEREAERAQEREPKHFGWSR